MGSSEIIRLCALTFQFIGILIGGGIIFEAVFRASPLKGLLFALNIPIRAFGKGLLHEYEISDDINEIYSRFSSPSYLLLPIFIVPFSLAFSLGLWIVLGYRIYQIFIYGTEIKLFWIAFSIWLFLLMLNYLMSVPLQLAIKGKINTREVKDIGGLAILNSLSSKPREWLIQFLKNFYMHPLELVKLQFLLFIVILQLLPAWFLKPIYTVELSSEKYRQRYYLTYSVTFLLLATSLQILNIFI